MTHIRVSKACFTINMTCAIHRAADDDKKECSKKKVNKDCSNRWRFSITLQKSGTILAKIPLAFRKVAEKFPVYLLFKKPIGCFKGVLLHQLIV